MVLEFSIQHSAFSAHQLSFLVRAAHCGFLRRRVSAQADLVCAKLFFRPVGATSFRHIPTACAVGFILAPLRGWDRPTRWAAPQDGFDADW